MIIKKHKNRNEYLLTHDKIWVRNPCKETVPFVDINKLSSYTDYNLYLQNETANFVKNYPKIEDEHFKLDNVVIVSDGLDFQEKQKLLFNLPKEVKIIGINGALKKWEFKKEATYSEERRYINYYVVNNPYLDCCAYLPNNNFYPKCLASTRTNPDFLKKYKGNIYIYNPVNDKTYKGPNFYESYCIDDYRNVICAAIGLAYRLGAKKILLFCCDNSFKEERSGSVRLKENIYTYPQHLITDGIIDGYIYWLKKQEIDIANLSNGLKFCNSTYINEESIKEFFMDEKE